MFDFDVGDIFGDIGNVADKIYGPLALGTTIANLVGMPGQARKGGAEQAELKRAFRDAQQQRGEEAQRTGVAAEKARRAGVAARELALSPLDIQSFYSPAAQRMKDEALRQITAQLGLAGIPAYSGYGTGMLAEKLGGLENTLWQNAIANAMNARTQALGGYGMELQGYQGGPHAAGFASAYPRTTPTDPLAALTAYLQMRRQQPPQTPPYVYGRGVSAPNIGYSSPPPVFPQPPSTESAGSLQGYEDPYGGYDPYAPLYDYNSETAAPSFYEGPQP